MKFTSSVVVLALAVVCAQASIVPLAFGAPWANSWTSTPLTAAPWNEARPVAVVPVSAPEWAATPLEYGAPAHVTYGAPAVQAVSAPALVPEATYTAANLGAVHVAPLPGHTQSVTILNLQPAPGTV